MDSSIRSLYDRKLISYETAIGRMKNPQEFTLLGEKTDPSKKRTFLGRK